AEEIGAWTWQPLSRPGVGRPCRHVPGRNETAEMIQANRVHVAQQRPQTVYQPAIPQLTKNLPVVQWIAPELPKCTEIVGGYTGDKSRPPMLIEQKELRMRPNIARVGRDEERQVADQSETLGTCVALQPLRLAEHQELRKA